MVIAAAFVGLVGPHHRRDPRVVTVVGIPFAIGLLGLALPGLFVIGYIVDGIWVGELILGRSSPVEPRAAVPRGGRRPDPRRA